MFDIGFFEILVIGVVALLVVGPERLPKLARDVGRFVGKTRRFVSSVRADVERELATDELKEMMREQNREIERLKNLMSDAEDSIARDVRDIDRGLKREIDDQRQMIRSLDDDPRIPGIRREPVKLATDGSLTGGASAEPQGLPAAGQDAVGDDSQDRGVGTDFAATDDADTVQTTGHSVDAETQPREYEPRHASPDSARDPINDSASAPAQRGDSRTGQLPHNADRK
ncbi:MAG: Sec-independent protein translocase protein TatB [Thioalkalivibrionaceae bacterium]